MDVDTARRFFDKAVEIDLIAQRYGVDPYTIVYIWPIAQYDFNRNILLRALDEENRRNKKMQ